MPIMNAEKPDQYEGVDHSHEFEADGHDSEKSIALDGPERASEETKMADVPPGK